MADELPPDELPTGDLSGWLPGTPPPGEPPTEDLSPDLDRPVARSFHRYREAARTALPPPRATALFEVARVRAHRRRLMTGLAAAGVAVLVAGGAVAHTLLNPPSAPTAAGRNDAPPAAGDGPAGTPTSPSGQTPTPDPPASAGGPAGPLGVRTIDLRQATVTLPAWHGGTGCPPGQVRFTDGSARRAGFDYQILPDQTTAAYGDVDGRPGEEALAPLSCAAGSGGAFHAVLALRLDQKHKLHAMGYVFRTDDPTEGLGSLSVEDNNVVLTVLRLSLGPASTPEQLRYHWNGHKFVTVDSSPSPTASGSPPVNPSDLPGSGTPAPGG